METTMQSEEQSRYKIGAVAKLTGLPTETIRTWERRYKLVVPERSESGLRLYSVEDIAILRSVRTLSEQGEAVSRLAGLTLAELKERLGRHGGWGLDAGVRLTSLRQACRLGIVGSSLSEQATHLEADLGSDWVVAWRHGALKSLQGLAPVDVLLCESRGLGEDPLGQIRRLVEKTEASVTVLIYDYLSVSQIQSFSLAGIKLLRGPVRTPLLIQSVQDHLELARLRRVALGNEPSPKKTFTQERVFSDVALARLQNIKSSITCECPSQLSTIVAALVAFEDYSRGCESKNAEDALLHARLAAETSHARVIMEELLMDICRHEQIDLG